MENVAICQEHASENNNKNNKFLLNLSTEEEEKKKQNHGNCLHNPSYGFAHSIWSCQSI
jgi:hypothetical protein